VAGLIVYGSTARGEDDELSDLDLVVVTSGWTREAVWGERQRIAETIFGQPVVWEQELPWQRRYRYQAWRGDLAQLDVTFDEGAPSAPDALREGHLLIVDKVGIAPHLSALLSTQADYDARTFDGSTWVWFNWIYGRLRKGQFWLARTNLTTLVEERIRPLIATAAHAVESSTTRSDRDALLAGLPASTEYGEILRALRAALTFYETGIGRWYHARGLTAARHPLAEPIRRRVLGTPPG
jgi:hypothetical protein